MLTAHQQAQAQARQFAVYAGSSGGSSSNANSQGQTGQADLLQHQQHQQQLLLAVPSAIVFHDFEVLADGEERAEVEANISDLCRPYGQLEGVHAAGPGQEDAGLVYVHFAAPSQALAAVEGLRGRVVGGEELKVTLWCPTLPAVYGAAGAPLPSSSFLPPGSPTAAVWPAGAGGGGNPALSCFSNSSINMHGFALGGGGSGGGGGGGSAGDAAGVLDDAAECEEVGANAQLLAELFGTVLSVRVVRELEVHHDASSSSGGHGGGDEKVGRRGGVDSVGRSG